MIYFEKLNWYKSAFLLFTFFICCLFLSLSGSLPVKAASVYDGVVQIADDLIIKNYNNPSSGQIDISVDWMIESIEAYDVWCSSGQSGACTLRDELSNVLLTPGASWAVVTNADQTEYYIYWSFSLNAEFEFYMESGVTPAIRATGDEVVRSGQFIYLPGNMFANSSGIMANGFAVDRGTSWGVASSSNPWLFFLSTFPVTYPTGYEGELIPGIPAPPLDWTPNIELVSVIDWKIMLQDQNFNTFDPVPFTCNEGLTPIIQYILLNNDTSEEIDTGIFSPTVPYEFQSERYGIETEYKFVGAYYCGDNNDDPQFNNHTTYYFSVNASGVMLLDTPSCFLDEFPFIDMNGCVLVIERFVSHLSFGTINFPQWDISPNECHALGPIGDWINVPVTSRLICPQFSATIRNAVTPFLTFVLGITVAGAIITKTSKDVT